MPATNTPVKHSAKLKEFYHKCSDTQASLVMWVQFLDGEDAVEKKMATNSIPATEELGSLSPWGHRVGLQ